MKRFRLGTLMLFVIIAALATALTVQQHRASRREAAMQAEIASLRAASTQQQKAAYMAEIKALAAGSQAALARSDLLSGQRGTKEGHDPGAASP